MTTEPDTSLEIGPDASAAAGEGAAADGRLRWAAADRAAVERHAEETYPHECCGVLLGEPLPEGGEGGVVTAVRRLDNEREDSRHNRYLVRPEAVLAVEREARSRDLAVLGWYHSHPDHPAVPSDFDREHAWPGMSYVIVSVDEGHAVATRSWRLTEDRSRFDEEELLEKQSPGTTGESGPPVDAPAKRARAGGAPGSDETHRDSDPFSPALPEKARAGGGASPLGGRSGGGSSQEVVR